MTKNLTLLNVITEGQTRMRKLLAIFILKEDTLLRRIIIALKNDGFVMISIYS